MIRMNAFQSEPEALIQEELKAVERVIRSGWYILGREVEKFEERWADVSNVSYAIGVGNGMEAIEIGLRSLGIGPGDEVITTAMTAFATVLAVLRAGAIPVLADIDPMTGLLDLSSVKRCLTAKTKAVLLVHLYGHVSNMDSWVEFCSNHQVFLLEDCAQSHLAKWKGKSSGSFGKWGAFSFYPTKNLGALGDGGALVTWDKQVSEKAKILRNYGQSIRYHHPELGLNSRLDELQAALISVRFNWLDRFTERRKKIAKSYYEGISNPLIAFLSRPRDEENHVYHLFVILCEDRENLSDFLKERGIDTLIHYPIPVHFQPPTQEIRRDPEGLKHAEIHAQRCLSIPCHPQLSDDEISSVIETINEFC